MSEEVVKVPEIKIFSYHDDIVANFDELSYKVGDLLAMSEEEFNAVYYSYKKIIGKQLQEIEEKASAKLGLIGIIPVIDLMERIRLERRILKLESSKSE
jgi:hypothetical protein